MRAIAFFLDETKQYEFCTTWLAVQCPSFSDFLHGSTAALPQAQNNRCVTNASRQQRYLQLFQQLHTNTECFPPLGCPVLLCSTAFSAHHLPCSSLPLSCPSPAPLLPSPHCRSSASHSSAEHSVGFWYHQSQPHSVLPRFLSTFAVTFQSGSAVRGTGAPQLQAQGWAGRT